MESYNRIIPGQRLFWVQIIAPIIGNLTYNMIFIGKIVALIAESVRIVAKINRR